MGQRISPKGKIYSRLLPQGSLARTGLANKAGSLDPSLLTALIRNLYCFFGTKPSTLKEVCPGFTSPTLSHPATINHPSIPRQAQPDTTNLSNSNLAFQPHNAKSEILHHQPVSSTLLCNWSGRPL